MSVNLVDRFTADFETTSEENFKVEKCVRVWAWNIRSIDNFEIVGQGTNISSFLDFITNKDCEIFFHNLKFDGSFILYELFKRGFQYSKKIKDDHQFTCLIDESGSWYSIEICWKHYQKRNISCKIFDSFKKIPLSVKGMAKSYELEEAKGSIDYQKFREIGYEPTKDEWNYISNDTLIVAKVLKQHFDQGMEKMTIASDSYYYFKSLYNKKKFEYLFPTIDEDVHNYLKKSYKGGFVWVNPNFQGKIWKNVISFDVNSLYPDRMRNCLLPYGKPKFFKGEYQPKFTYPLYIQRIKCAFKIKKDHIPMIQIKHSMRWNESDYLESSENEIVELTLTSVDLKLFLNQYNVYHLEFIDGYMFRGRMTTFDEYIDHFYEIKQKESGGKKQIAKLFLNSLYGKFGSAIERINMIPYVENGEVKFTRSEKEKCQSKYIPMACFITSYAREKTILNAQKFMPNSFIYADTDSIHLKDVVDDETAKKIAQVKSEELVQIVPSLSEKLNIHSSDLGAWKYEGLAERCVFLRQKTYLKEKQGKLNVTACGMPESVKEKVNFDNFKIDAEFGGKLRQQKVKGGTLLSETTFKIRGKKGQK